MQKQIYPKFRFSLHLELGQNQLVQKLFILFVSGVAQAVVAEQKLRQLQQFTVVSAGAAAVTLTK
jgi:hypothetical protein